MKILLVDDDEVDALHVERLLREAIGEELDFKWVTDRDSGRDAIQEQDHDICLIDYRLGPYDGVELVRQVIDQGCLSPIILLTGMNSEFVDVQAMEAGATDYIIKDEMSAALLKKSIRFAIARQQFQSSLIEAKELLRQKNETLSQLYDTAHQFVNNVSHEFRTPLTVIKEFSSILAEGLAGDLNDKQLEYLDIILNRTDDLSIMIDDMLDISKIEAGLLGVFRKEVLIDEIIGRVKQTLERKASLSGVQLEFDIEEALNPVFCDPENIARVIINLGINAIKFSGKNGQIKIWAYSNDELSQVEIGVTDNGPGISQEDRKVIFDRFEQGGNPNKSSTKGFGLGLNIALELVSLNLGKMAVESNLGEGSIFKFTVPSFDPKVIVNNYVNFLDRFGDANRHVAVFETKIVKNSDQHESDRIEMFLQQQLRRNDLLIKQSSGEWLLCTHQSPFELGETIHRLQNALVAANDYVLADDLPEISYGTQGVWDLNNQREDFFQAFASA